MTNRTECDYQDANRYRLVDWVRPIWSFLVARIFPISTIINTTTVPWKLVAIIECRQVNTYPKQYESGLVRGLQGYPSYHAVVIALKTVAVPICKPKQKQGFISGRRHHLAVLSVPAWSGP